MANEQLIDTVISPEADAQVENLKKLLADLDIQMTSNIKSANALNAATANAKSFKDYTKNATDAALSLEKINQAALKTATATAKLNVEIAKGNAEIAKAAIQANNLTASNNKAVEANNKLTASEQKKAAALEKTQGEYKKLLASFNEATLRARTAGAAFGTDSEAYTKAAGDVQKLRKQLDNIDQPLGNFQRNVGNYGNAIAGAFSKAFSVIRQAAYILPGIGIAGIFNLLFEGATLLFNKLTEGKFALDEFGKTATALGKAFEDSGFKEAVSNVIELKEQIALANDGLIDQDVVLNKYNETIGKTIGQTDSLDKAQQLLVEHSADYIKSMFYKAAATAALAEGTDDLLKATKAVMNAEANQSLTDKDIAGLQNIIKTSRDKNEVEQAKGLLKMGMSMKKADDDNLAEAKQYQDKLVAQTASIYDKLSRLSGQYQTGFMSSADQQAQEKRNETAFNYNKKLLEDDLANQEQIAENEKKSYKTRFSALQKALEEKKQIIDIDQAQQLSKGGLIKAEEQKIIDDGNFQKLAAEREYIKKRNDLQDKQYKQKQDILKNDIQKPKDALKTVIDDPAQTYDAKLGALELYNARSTELIQANYKEQQKAAGENKESLRLAEQECDKATIQLANDTASQLLKIKKENLAKILEASKESEDDQISLAQDSANLALQALTDVRDKGIKIIDDKRKHHKISEKEYNQQLLDINDQYAIDRIRQEIALQSAILAIKEADRDNTVSKMEKGGATKEDISKFTSGANKGIQGTKNTISGLAVQLGTAVSKKESDDTKGSAKEAEEERKKIEQAATEATVTAIDEIDKLRQKAFEAEIQRLERMAQQIDDNANAEKKQVNDSIASNATKARQIKLIDAQTASAKKAIQAQENKEKQKAAKADKEATIAKIIATGALAVVSALATQPVYLGIVLAAITAASVAVELASAIATPLPQYAKGGTTKGGLAIWGEAGVEMATEPSGKRYLSPDGATVAAFPKGTIITPHMELMQQIRPDVPVYAGGEAIGWREVVKAINGQNRKQERPRVVVNVDMGFENYKQQYLSR